MEADPKVLVMGEDIGKLGGVFRVTDGLQKDFGEDRVIDTPLAESGIVGTAIGLALRGYRPGRARSSSTASSSRRSTRSSSQLAKMHARALGKVKLPVVIRIPYGGGIGAVEHHSESPEALFAHVAGLRVVCCSDPVGRLLDDPAGHRERRPGDLLRAQAPLLGQGRGRRRELADPRPAAPGHASSARGHRRHARRLRPDGEDLPGGRGGRRGGGPAWRSWTCARCRRSTSTRVAASVEKTGRLVVVHEAPVSSASGAEIAARITERCFYHLEAPVLRVGGFHAPYPPAGLEEEYLPGLDRVLDAVDRVAGVLRRGTDDDAGHPSSSACPTWARA